MVRQALGWSAALGGGAAKAIAASSLKHPPPQDMAAAGGTAVLWSRQRTPYATTVVKAVTMNGLATETSLTSSTDKVRDQETKQRYVGIQIENDDRRHSEAYKVYWIKRYSDGSSQETEQDISYTFQSAGETKVGPCMIVVYRGEISYTDTKSGQTIHMFHIHFPELKMSISSTTPDVQIDGVSTSFDPITPLH